ncbi:Crp/Fnr family transcriptional regulator [Aureimonas frigidaquae]|uniref:Crp/Fnr family transcriptional regulator n=1 Tax=Aureimonas frigidaquae TaxID=424757 RepID=UPI000AF01F44|nr:Crp/Fnr family transcriptional regulator [Aureimonas frigidaquae]
MKSCLVAKLSHYLDLTREESRFLATMEGRTERYPRRRPIIAGNAEFSDIYVVRQGWLYAHTTDLEGDQIVTELFHPGDVVGVSQLGCAQSTLVYTAATDVELCPFPKAGLREAFANYPRIAALFFTFVSLERVSMMDRLRAASSMNARDRVALFLMQCRARQRIAGALEGGAFVNPLSQELIGDVVGLSVVSVNRALRLLEEQGHLRRDGRVMELLNPERLGYEIDFVDRMYQIDASWFPEAASA